MPSVGRPDGTAHPRFLRRPFVPPVRRLRFAWACPHVVIGAGDDLRLDTAARPAPQVSGTGGRAAQNTFFDGDYGSTTPYLHGTAWTPRRHRSRAASCAGPATPDPALGVTARHQRQARWARHWSCLALRGGTAAARWPAWPDRWFDLDASTVVDLQALSASGTPLSDSALPADRLRIARARLEPAWWARCRVRHSSPPVSASWRTTSQPVHQAKASKAMAPRAYSSPVIRVFRLKQTATASQRMAFASAPSASRRRGVVEGSFSGPRRSSGHRSAQHYLGYRRCQSTFGDTKRLGGLRCTSPILRLQGHRRPSRRTTVSTVPSEHRVLRGESTA